MISCRFVGENCVVGEREFDAVGQRAAFSEEQFKRIILGGGTFITADAFNNIGFTAKELTAYGPAADRDLVANAFGGKLFRAQQVFRETREKILSEE